MNLIKYYNEYEYYGQGHHNQGIYSMEIFELKEKLENLINRIVMDKPIVAHEYLVNIKI